MIQRLMLMQLGLLRFVWKLVRLKVILLVARVEPINFTEHCNQLWSFEAVRGATLVNNDTKILTNNISRSECEQHCINETNFICKSIKFKLHNESVGQCILSNSNRHLTPFAYRVSTNNDYYLEYQCTNNSTQQSKYSISLNSVTHKIPLRYEKRLSRLWRIR